jgi:glutamate N-acetyltransferase / amino-acid N-acetyltransferase
MYEQSNMIPEIAGVKFAVAESNIKYKGRNDLLIASFSDSASVAGAFTTSSITSPTIGFCRESLKHAKAKLLIVNSGNANCFTGQYGVEVIEETAKNAAKLFNCKKNEIFISSTGVIGEKLPVAKIINKLPECKLNLGTASFNDAAKAIMTTDSFYKVSSIFTHIAGSPVTINAISKGAGMAGPNLATVLTYVFTDADIPSEILQKIFNNAIDKSLNCMTVDGDMSTNDTALIFATAKAQNQKIKSATDPNLKDFTRSLEQVLIDLAQLIARDGEGATKFLTVNVTGAQNQKAAREVGLSIANSPLVKTAIAGEDPNWGRIAMAIGKSKQKLNLNKLSIKIGDYLVAVNGALNPDYDEASTTAIYMKEKDIEISVDLGLGQKETNSAIIYSCDLTKGYIEINADYRS